MTTAALLAASGAAYATADVWRPALGNNPDSRPAAVTGDLPDWLKKAIPSFGRPQLESDRDAAAEFALSISGGAGERVLTAWVRRLGDTDDAEPIVLTPILGPDGKLELCLTVGTGRDGAAAKTCGPAEAVSDGRLVLASGRVDASPTERAAYDRAIGKFVRENPGGGKVPATLRPPSGRLKLVGVVPAELQSVETVDGRVVDVDDLGVFEALVDEADIGPDGLRVTPR